MIAKPGESYCYIKIKDKINFKQLIKIKKLEKQANKKLKKILEVKKRRNKK